MYEPCLPALASNNELVQKSPPLGEEIYHKFLSKYFGVV